MAKITKVDTDQGELQIELRRDFKYDDADEEK